MATIKKLLQSAPRMRNSVPTNAAIKNSQKATTYVGTGVLRRGGNITPVPNGPLIKKDGTSLKKGGMIKRKDGSFSKHGLWDSIRENKGSGKKPTAEMLKQEKKIKSAKNGAWQRKEGKNPEGGLNAKGRASYNRETGGHLKAPQPEGGPRKRSFCSRMSGMKKKNTSSKTANDPNSRINKSLRKWNC